VRVPRSGGQLVGQDAHRRRFAARRDGNLREASLSMESLLPALPDHDQGARLQRFYAAEVLVRAQLTAALEAPFLREARSAPGADYRIDAVDGAAPHSSIAHLCAAAYYASYARQWYPDVQAQGTAQAGELLPEDLVALGPRNAIAFLNLAMLTVYARLGFQDRVEQVVAGIPELESLDTCELVLAGAEMPRAARPWVYLGVFDRLERSDEPEAYRFATRTLESSENLAGAPGRAQLDALVEWIQHGSRYVFKCPNDKTVVDPRLQACPVCRKPNIDFEPELRAR
jgi:hypothetical protein